jgi:hypothetical protein
MNRTALILIGSLFILFYSCAKEKIKEDQEFKVEVDTKEFREFASGFMKELKSELMKNLEEGGPAQAVYVCSDSAQKITSRYSLSNINLKRVSLRTRNDLNTPNEYEIKVLNYFNKLNNEELLTDTTEVAELFVVNGRKYIKYMKPILLQAPCLNCHGTKEQISDFVVNLIDKKYPNDHARNFKIGDVRGAISIKKFLN